VTPLSQIEPVADIDQLFPENAAFMARSDLYQTRLLGYKPLNIDAVTTLLMGVLGNRSTVRHRSCATDEILSFLTDSGLRIYEDMHLFETGDEAEAFADRLVNQGKKLFWPYPLKEARFADDAHLVSPTLWAQLNSKERLGDLVSIDALPERCVIPLEQLARDFLEKPVYLKAAGVAATGWGYSVRYVCSDDDIETARADFDSQGVARILVEEAIDVATCWCASLGVSDVGVTYLGAAEQTFVAHGRQAGSIIDPDLAFPSKGVALALEVVETAWRRGFRGVCGLDIGLSHDGRMFVFDPNFRFNSSTTQVLLHTSASARSELRVSAAFNGLSTRPMAEILALIAGPVADGWFVPTRLLDETLLEAAKGTSLCTGFVMGRTRIEAQAHASRLVDMLE
jgi:hypothetical protein